MLLCLPSIFLLICLPPNYEVVYMVRNEVMAGAEQQEGSYFDGVVGRVLLADQDMEDNDFKAWKRDGNRILRPENTDLIWVANVDNKTLLERKMR